MDKLDPRLERLAASGVADVRTRNPDDLIHVYVEAAGDDFSGLAAAGFGPISELAGSAIVILPIARLRELETRDDVLAVHSPPVGEPQAVVFSVDQQAVKLKEAFQVKSPARPNGTRGAGVAVGIVDSGVNVMHDAFRTAPPGRKSRIAFYWAQDDNVTTGGGPLWDRMGKVFTGAEIDALIAADPSGLSLPEGLVDKPDHGTGVASIAAGSAWPSDAAAKSQQTGVAPEANLIVVSGQRDNQAGIEFCLAKADALNPKLPCVVNMSLGDHSMPHNGRSAFDKRNNTLLSAQAGRALVVSAGNHGAALRHARVDIPTHPGFRTFDIVVLPGEFKLELLVSGSGAGGVKATVAPPLATRTAARTFFGDGDAHPQYGFVIGAATGVSAGDAHWHTSVVVNPLATYLTTGAWQLKLETVSAVQPVVDVWTDRKGGLEILPFAGAVAAKEEDLETDPKRRRPRAWIDHTLNSQACGLDAIVVGIAEVGRTDKTLVTLHRSSSRGPNTDPTIPQASWKPDLLAPGENIKVASWQPPAKASGRGVSSSKVQSGTSFAAPMVTGTVALMLSHDKTLKHTDIRAHLRASATALTHPKTVAWMTKFDIGRPSDIGAGLVSINGAQDRVNGP